MTETQIHNNVPIIGNNTATWKIIGGPAIATHIAPLGASLPCCAGIYIICKRNDSGLNPLFVGSCENLADRLNESLTRIPRFKSLIEVGADFICYISIDDHIERNRVKQDFILSLNPPFNLYNGESLRRQA